MRLSHTFHTKKGDNSRPICYTKKYNLVTKALLCPSAGKSGGAPARLLRSSGGIFLLPYRCIYGKARNGVPPAAPLCSQQLCAAANLLNFFDSPTVRTLRTVCTEVFFTRSQTNPLARLGTALLLLLALLCLRALPARAEELSPTLDRLGRLQTLAQQFVQEQQPEQDAILLALSYTRVNGYNSTVWQLTAGTRDPAFESYANTSDPDLTALQGVKTVTLPDGSAIDFGHLLAALNLVYKGIPITGSWGGDCMELAKGYAGQAQDVAGYTALMTETFGIPDDGSVSRFGDQDLRADLDAVVVGSTLTAESDLAAVLRDYYASVTAYDRAYQFIALSFGNVDTGNAAAFRNTVYDTLVQDAGMQLLLYLNGMWTVDGWQIDAASQPALRAASDLFADYLAACVQNGKVKSDVATRQVTQAHEALIEALTVLGENEAASAAAQALAGQQGPAADSSTSSVDSLAEAAHTIQTRFNVKAFQLVLLIVGAVAVFGLIPSIALFVVHQRELRG